MKKATKLLTVVAMAATLILGAGAFVSCSNSSDSSSSTQTAEQKAEALEKQIDKMVEDFEALGYQEITVENVKSWMGGVMMMRVTKTCPMMRKRSTICSTMYKNG